MSECFDRDILNYEIPHDVINFYLDRFVLNHGSQYTGVPQDFIATPGSEEIVLTWHGWHEFYEIQRSLDGSSWANLATTSNTTYTDSTTDGTTYYYRIRGYECGKYSCWSDSVNAFSGAYPLILDGYPLLLDGYGLYLGGV